MEVLVIVLNQEKHYDNLIALFDEHNIHGGTIIESQGLATHSLDYTNSSHLDTLRTMLNSGRPYNRTLFLVLDEKRMEIAKSCVREAAGGLETENVGIMFTLPLSSFEGLTK